MATLAERLVEAEDALHRLTIGRATVEVEDSSGERVKYGFANRAALAAYVADLRRQIAGASLPKTILFSTRKGV